jgi:hypothetical protein
MLGFLNWSMISMNGTPGVYLLTLYIVTLGINLMIEKCTLRGSLEVGFMFGLIT